jgi:anti-sigma-K factor RskA
MTPFEDMDGMTADEALAMDFALGALDRNERRAADLRLRSDPAFRTLVDDWSTRLAPLDDETADVAPPPEVWAAISAEISPAMRPAVVAAAVAAERPSLWQNLMLWRGLSFAGVAAALIAIVQVGPPVPPPVPGAPPQLLVAALAGADGKPLLSAAYDPLRGAVVLTPATQRQDEGKSAELWVIEGKNPPRSLGVIDIKDPNKHVITSAQLKGLESGATLAISIEPYGGSPTGQPTGPVVATGMLRAV